MTGYSSSSVPVLRRAILWDAIAAVAIAVVTAVIGGLASGWPGIWAGLLGGAVAAVFAGLTAGSILFSERFAGRPSYPFILVSLVMGGWIVKLVLFLVVALLLRQQPWLQPTVLFLSIIASVLATLVVDVVVFVRSRVLYVSDAG